MTLSRTKFVALALSGAAMLAAGASAQTQQQCHNASIPLTTTNWALSVSVPKFDPNLGTLQSITFNMTGFIEGDARAESLDNQPTVATLQFAGTITLTRPDMSQIVQVLPVANFVDPLGAFDGVIDFRGPSGVSHLGVAASQMSSFTSPPPASDLVLFTGPGGNPGTITLPVTAVGTSVATGPGNIVSQFTQRARVDVQVCYNFLPNTPPNFTVCNATVMASAGVPVSFQVCAADSNPGDIVTLTSSPLPAGSSLTPPLPASGNPICTTFNWTPLSSQVGNTVIVFTATDNHQRTATCTVTIVTAECHMLFAGNSGNSQQTIFGHLYDTNLAGLRRFYPVTMEDQPSFPVQFLPSSFFVQVVMYNPEIFPQNPSQWTQAMQVNWNAAANQITTSYTGDFNGMGVRAVRFTDGQGVQRVRFPFTINGM
jgi:hypothetical protein